MGMAPAKRPCGSCPYRRDAPSGLWAPEEYAKLPEYDRPTYDQPVGTFYCHQQDGHVCAGWAGCHDTTQLLALRLPCHGLNAEELAKTHEYVSPVPLFDSGREAADHGMRDLTHPDEKTVRMARRLKKKKDMQWG